MRCSPPPLAPASFSAAVASRDATSPACAPPMPSAIAKSGGSMTYASSLWRRVRPGSVTAATRPIMCSRLIPQIGLTDADDVALRQPAGTIEARAVQVGAVRRAEVLHPDAVLARLEPRVACGGVLVGANRDVVLAAAPDRQLRRVELEVAAFVEVRALDDDQPAGDPAAPARLDAGVTRRSEDEALLRHPQVAARRAHDPPDEEIEQDEERDLEDEQDLIDGGGVVEHRYSDSRAKRNSVDPSVIVSPLCSFARLTRLPLTSSPLVDPRSTIQYDAPSWRSSACRRETFASASWMSQSRERPITMRCCFTS